MKGSSNLRFLLDIAILSFQLERSWSWRRWRGRSRRQWRCQWCDHGRDGVSVGSHRRCGCRWRCRRRSSGKRWRHDCWWGWWWKCAVVLEWKVEWGLHAAEKLTSAESADHLDLLKLSGRSHDLQKQVNFCFQNHVLLFYFSNEFFDILLTKKVQTPLLISTKTEYLQGVEMVLSCD